MYSSLPRLGAARAAIHCSQEPHGKPGLNNSELGKGQVGLKGGWQVCWGWQGLGWGLVGLK